MTLDTVTISAAGRSVTLTGEQFDRAAKRIINASDDEMDALIEKSAGRTVDPATGEITEPATRGATAADDKPEPGQLPEAVLDSFRQFYGAGSKHQWDIGRVVDDALIEFAGKISANRIIRAAAKEMDLSRSQVLKCQTTWRATDEALRSEFDMLPFECFAVVTRYIKDRLAMAQWLALVVESGADYGGRFMPTKKLEAKIKAYLGIAAPEPTWDQLYDRAVTAVENLRDHADTETRHQKVAAVLALLQKVN